MKTLIIGSVMTLLTACSSSSKIDSGSWTCDGISKHVITMSQQEESKILEISNITEIENVPNYRLSCSASAEWSQGEGGLDFGAHVSDGGKIIVEYNRK